MFAGIHLLRGTEAGSAAACTHPACRLHAILCGWCMLSTASALYTFGSACRCIRVKHNLNTLGVESWSVINDQDAVARGGKFMGLFKRAGDRIFLNQKGDMLVCPIFLEAALWRKLGNTSVRHHMMAAYLKVRVGQHPYDICK